MHWLTLQETSMAEDVIKILDTDWFKWKQLTISWQEIAAVEPHGDNRRELGNAM
jgi:hypothetical protein